MSEAKQVDGLHEWEDGLVEVSWETNARRFSVPGGWLYFVGDEQPPVFVPDPGATVEVLQARVDELEVMSKTKPEPVFEDGDSVSLALPEAIQMMVTGFELGQHTVSWIENDGIHYGSFPPGCLVAHSRWSPYKVRVTKALELCHKEAEQIADPEGLDALREVAAVLRGEES